MSAPSDFLYVRLVHVTIYAIPFRLASLEFHGLYQLTLFDPPVISTICLFTVCLIISRQALWLNHRQSAMNEAIMTL